MSELSLYLLLYMSKYALENTVLSLLEDFSYMTVFSLVSDLNCENYAMQMVLKMYDHSSPLKKLNNVEEGCLKNRNCVLRSNKKKSTGWTRDQV